MESISLKSMVNTKNYKKSSKTYINRDISVNKRLLKNKKFTANDVLLERIISDEKKKTYMISNLSICKLLTKRKISSD